MGGRAGDSAEHLLNAAEPAELDPVGDTQRIERLIPELPPTVDPVTSL